VVQQQINDVISTQLCSAMQQRPPAPLAAVDVETFLLHGELQLQESITAHKHQTAVDGSRWQ
jgi:hypothetical protein